MVKRKPIFIALILFFLLGPVQNMRGQFFKKLKKNMDDKIEKKVDNEIDALLNEKSPKTPEQKNNNNQTKTKSKSNPQNSVPQINETNIITYKAPSTDFIDITIQSHKGMPRYGDIHYRLGVTAPVNRNGYKALVELKYFKEMYVDINRSKLTSYEENSSGDQKQKNSYFAQSHLKNLAGNVCSEEVLKKYFCDTTTKPVNTNNKYKNQRNIPCKFIDAYGTRRPPSHWGGSRNNEFQQQRSYKEFLEKHLTALQSWADTFYENGEQVVYYVSRSAIIGKYDFKNKGYWLSGLLSSGSSGFMLHSSNFLAYSENEKKIKNSHQQFFFSISPQKAKEFNLQDRVPITCVFKVKVLPKISNDTNIQFEFELVDQTIEIYSKNPALTDKLGEINIESLIAKY